jgi:hypothetical protein
VKHVKIDARVAFNQCNSVKFEKKMMVIWVIHFFSFSPSFYFNTYLGISLTL